MFAFLVSLFLSRPANQPLKDWQTDQVLRAWAVGQY